MTTTRKFKFAKLVRDKVLEDMLANPQQKPTYKVLDDVELREELIKKLTEEVSELDKVAAGGFIKELADIVEIIKALQQLENISDADLDKQRAEKLAKAGGFSKRYYIHDTETAVESEWIDYYLSEPEKYPEIS